MLSAEIQAAIAAELGVKGDFDSCRSVSGGDINEAYCLTRGGQKWFAKVNRVDAARMFAAESDGLRALAETGAFAVPKPIAQGDANGCAFLVLEWLDLAPTDGDGGAALGNALARLHAVREARFGWHCENFIGASLQTNTTDADWATFFARERIGRQLEIAAHNGYRGELQALGEKLVAAIPAFFAGVDIPVALLHGDLWRGNCGMTLDGRPAIFDPAVYFGDPETDIAMTELFGGFAGNFYSAYRAVRPDRTDGQVHRLLYRLYHILNHLNLFAGGYRSQAGSVMRQLLAESQ